VSLPSVFSKISSRFIYVVTRVELCIKELFYVLKHEDGSGSYSKEMGEDRLLIHISSLPVIVLTLIKNAYLNSFVRDNSPVSSLYTS
jgi:hypothetical protein